MARSVEQGRTPHCAPVVALGRREPNSYPLDRSPFLRFLIGVLGAIYFTFFILLMALCIICAPLALLLLFLVFV